MPLEPDLVFPPLRLDLAQHQLWRGTERVPLRPKAFAVLRYLVAHAPGLVTPAALLHAVWADAYVSEGLLRGYMRELQAVLGDEAQAPRFIATVARPGWRFPAPVTTAPPPADHPPSHDLRSVAPLAARPAALAAPGRAPPSALPEPTAARSPAELPLDEEYKLVTVVCCALTDTPALAAHLGPEALFRLTQTVFATARR
jgi:DNA-binding winged helix-turn-helix (wHTH) protein